MSRALPPLLAQSVICSTGSWLLFVRGPSLCLRLACIALWARGLQACGGPEPVFELQETASEEWQRGAGGPGAQDAHGLVV